MTVSIIKSEKAANIFICCLFLMLKKKKEREDICIRSSQKKGNEKGNFMQ